jgi:hypothetical protein
MQAISIFGITISNTTIDIFGYIASAIVLSSFLIKDIKKLRIVNSIGCAFFILYGLLLGSNSIIITNVGIVFINIWYLTRKSN